MSNDATGSGSIIRTLFGNVIQPDAGFCERHQKDYVSFRIQVNGEWVGGCPECAIESADVLRRQEQEVMAREARIASANQRIGRSGIPSEMLRCSFDNYESESEGQKLALSVTREFVENWGDHPEQWLLLMGNYGNGKTHLACAAAMEIARRYKHGEIMYTPAYNLSSKIRSSFTDSDVSEFSIKRSIALFDGLLILDDLGWQQGSDYDRQVTSEIIAERYSHGKSLVLLTNMDEDQMASFLGYQVFDRVVDRASAVGFSWDSYRGKRSLNMRGRSGSG